MDGHMQFHHSVLARLSFASRCLTALVFGGTIPLAAALAAATVMGSETVSASTGTVGRTVLAAALVGSVVFAGRIGLRALEQGWGAFLGYVVVVASVAALIRLAAQI